jgi:hypothetical protein
MKSPSPGAVTHRICLSAYRLNTKALGFLEGFHQPLKTAACKVLIFLELSN